MKQKPSPLVRLAVLVLAAGAVLTGAPARAKPLPSAQEILAADPAAGKLLAVPFLAQDRYECGPASLAMVLRYYGLEADPEQIARRFETAAVAGTFTVDLVVEASARGLDAHWVTGSLAALKQELNQGRPVIVFLNLAVNPLPARHFCVAVGWVKYRGRDCLVLHSGPTAWLLVPERKFMRQWKRTGRMMMTVAEPGEDPKASPSPGATGTP